MAFANVPALSQAAVAALIGLEMTAGKGHIVIIGAGQAGVMAAESLRGNGYEGEVTLLGAESHPPYHRPPLSKTWLTGEIGPAQLEMRAPEVLQKKNITFRPGARVAAIDRAASTVKLDSGESIAYSGLVLATGAKPRELPGARFDRLVTLRTRDDADRIGTALADCRKRGLALAVIGGGFIGLEIAASARKLGVEVTVIELAPRLLGRVVTPLISDWFARLHRAHGVQVLLDARIESIREDRTGALEIDLGGGRALRCGLAVAGIGIVPDDSLAREAGLAVERGIIVDACGRTEDPRIVAAGDCCARRQTDGSLLRLESVHNASEQARCAAASLLGRERPFSGTPWFWSDQYEVKLQMAGISTSADASVVRGSVDEPAFSVFHYRGGGLVSVDSINASKDHLLARKLLDVGVSPSPEQAKDRSFSLASLLPAA
jgi:3-phenylpropionate/trans-cinnamate dioxygenase ferredoxin reductase component